MADEEMAHQPRAAGAELPKDSSSSSWVGMGWGRWATPKLSLLSDLQMAAEEITRKAMEAAKGAARGVTESPGSEENSNSEGPTQEANDAPSVATGEVPVSLDAAKNATNLDEKMREATLKIFEDASKDSFLGHGLKILDNSVESLASGAWQALGTAWKGSVSFAQKLENSAENFAGTMQTGDLTAKATAFAPTLIEGGKVLTARGIEMLEYVGRETMDIIISETGIKLEDDAKQSDLLGSGVENDDIEEDITFDRCFYIYGGPEHLEELEALSSHHALLCNRARAKLSNDQRIAFDGLVKQIREIFTLGNENNVDSPTDKGKRMEMENTSEANEIRALHDSSVRKAAELAMGFTATIGGLAMTEVVQKTCDRLEAMKAEGIHRLSELCALCIAHFVTLGNSLLATKSSEVFDPRNGYYEFEWPDDCVGKAINIRTKARAMAKDIEAVVDSFLTGIGDVTATFQAAIAQEVVLVKDSEGKDMRHGLLGEASIEEQASTISGSLESDGSAAIEKMQDALHRLLYVVIYTSL